MTYGTLRYEPRQGYSPFDALESQARVESFIHHTNDLFYALRHEIAKGDDADLTPRNRDLHSKIANHLKRATQSWSAEELKGILDLSTGILEKRFELNRNFAAVERATKLFWAPRIEYSDFTNFTLLGRNYDQQVINELAALPIREKPMKDKHRFMFYGSGALPIDAIQMCLRAGRKGTCLSGDLDEVKAAKKFLARSGYDKLIRYHHVEYSQSGYAYEDHTLAFFNNVEVDNFDAMSNHAVVRWAEDAVMRSAGGADAIFYKTFSPGLARDLRIKIKRTALSTPDTMQTSHFTTVIIVPESVAKPGIGGGAGGLMRPLHLIQEEMLRPDSQYLSTHKFSQKMGVS